MSWQRRQAVTAASQKRAAQQLLQLDELFELLALSSESGCGDPAGDVARARRQVFAQPGRHVLGRACGECLDGFQFGQRQAIAGLAKGFECLASLSLQLEAFLPADALTASALNAAAPRSEGELPRPARLRPQ